jgi:Cu(I)/Ag(I) efflux system membrane fusion protein
MKQILQFVLGLLIISTATHAHSDAFKPKFVDTLVTPYLAIQKGLAGDDIKAAKLGASAFLEAMKNAPHEGDAHQQSADLLTPAKRISSESDIKAARTVFLDLSVQMTTLIKHVGVTTETPLYTAFCPMAFDGKGGSWIQSGKTVANPYYGSMMLRCGSVKEQIAGSTDHSMHAH